MLQNGLTLLLMIQMVLGVEMINGFAFENSNHSG
jgi:hypothetical protein